MKKAIVLGARPQNIGGAIAEALCAGGWTAHEDDCMRVYEGHTGAATRYEAPSEDELAPYDACVITLGVTHMQRFTTVSKEDFRKVLRGSLELPLECARRYAQGRLSTQESAPPYSQPHSKIVFIGSYANDHPFTHCTSYCVAKAGLDMAARSLAWELMPEGFDVHIVHPNHVEGTPMTEQIREGMQRGVHKMTSKQAWEYQFKDLGPRMGRLLLPEDIGEMVVWLLESEQARWLSGNGVRMYGGCR